jgi:hypothetical protein
MGRAKTRGLSRRAAFDQAGIHYSAGRDWLKRKGGRLETANLERAAIWLEITVDKAVELQGGTAEERWLEIARAAAAVQHKRVRNNPRLAKQAAERMARAVRGKRFSEEHRKRQSAGLKAYRQRPDAHALHVLENPQPIETQLAQALGLRRRSCPKATEQEMQGWASEVSARYDVCRAKVIACWNVYLKKRRCRGLGGNPSDTEKCDEACAFLEAYPWPGKQRPRRYWSTAGAPLQSWCESHSRGCPRLRRRYESSGGELSENPPAGQVSALEGVFSSFRAQPDAMLTQP